MPLIELRDVHKSYQLGETTVRALRGVDLRVQAGEFTMLMGPSGSGKTTLLNIIGCLDSLDRGDYELDGQALGGRDFNDMAEIRNRQIAFIFQSFNLIPVLNVAENIEFPRLIRGEPRRSLRQMAQRIAKEVGLDDFLHHKPDQLSGGQRQRVAIARALITEPVLVLADEPTASLDSVTAQQIIDLMLRLNREKGVTFLLSTHDPRIKVHARRVVHIEDGRLVEEAVAGRAAAAQPA